MTEKLFETALGIEAPWFVAGVDFKAQARTLTIRIDFTPDSRFAIPGVDGEHPQSTIRFPSVTGTSTSSSMSVTWTSACRG